MQKHLLCSAMVLNSVGNKGPANESLSSILAVLPPGQTAWSSSLFMDGTWVVWGSPKRHYLSHTKFIQLSAQPFSTSLAVRAKALRGKISRSRRRSGSSSCLWKSYGIAPRKLPRISPLTEKIGIKRGRNNSPNPLSPTFNLAAVLEAHGLPSYS